MGKSWLAMLIASVQLFVVVSSAPAGSNTKADNKALSKELYSNATSILVELNKHSSQSSRIVRFFGGLKSWLSDQTRTFSSALDYKDVERIRTDIVALDKLAPPKLDSLLDRGQMRTFAKSEGTIVSGAAELRKMYDAADLRDTEIRRLREQRESLAHNRDVYASSEDTVRGLADKLGNEIGNVPFNIAFLYKGKSLPMSWYDLSEELRPALADRVSAADAAIKRYNAEIANAERDLSTFNELRSAIGRMWNGSTLAPSQIEIDSLRQKVRNETEHTLRSADQMRREAAEIRDHNAKIDAIQRIMSLGSSLGDLYNAGKALGRQNTKDDSPNSIRIGPGIDSSNSSSSPPSSTPSASGPRQYRN
ncbi:hypothetical protein ES707_00809 [subsurface metagenome]